ncbi:MAG: ATP-binding protein [Holosporaceae bacterium]|jgi:predicted AAA+ superfamily ATPase|nr:ATP-binding protein [Holosporaceae bacterium]
MEKKYKRWMEASLKQALSKRRVVVISGARQCGKTTLSKQIAIDNSIFRSLDDITLLKAAIDDPNGFVKHSHSTMIIDEIQKAPDLLPAIKQIVDFDNRAGQFLLTGSADIKSLPQVSESLAGRIKNIRLRTLSQGELLGNKPKFMQMLFDDGFPAQIKGYDKREILKIAFRGGYPEVVNFSDTDRKDWHLDYVNTLLSRDLKIIANVKRKAALEEQMRILAAWSSKLMDTPGMCSKLSIGRQTFDSYVGALEVLYLFEQVNPWCRTDYARVGRKDKIFITDTGIMASILNWNFEEVYLNPERSGKMIETFAYNELAIQAEIFGCRIFHYRDREDREIDFIIEDQNGQIACVEIKSGSAVSKDDFRHILWFKNNIVKNKDAISIILYSGENTVSFGDGLLAVPMAALWN